MNSNNSPKYARPIRRRENDLLRNTTKGKERKKTTKLRIKETIWGVTCEETQKEEGGPKNKPCQKPEEGDIKRRKNYYASSVTSAASDSKW